MKNNVNNYIWFIKESQSFMAHHYSKNKVLNSVIVFVLSLGKGFGFCNMMNRDSA